MAGEGPDEVQAGTSRPGSTHTTASTLATDLTPNASSSSLIGRLVQSVKPRPSPTRSTTSERVPSSSKTGRLSRRGSATPSAEPEPSTSSSSALAAPPVPPLPDSLPGDPTEPKGKAKGLAPPPTITTSAAEPDSPGGEKRDPFSRFVRPLFKRTQSGKAGPNNDPPVASTTFPAAAKSITVPLPASVGKRDEKRGGLTMAASPKRRSATLGTSPTMSHSTDAPEPLPPIVSPAVSLASSLTAYLTQPALLTLSQLAPAQLLSLQQLQTDIDNPTSSAVPLSEGGVPRTDRTRKRSGSADKGAPPTTEQLSASSLALPTTSIVGLWRLLKCVDWVREKDHDLSAASLLGATDPPRSKEKASFDIANTLQNVGDILSSISAAAGVELVFFHAFYAPAREDDARPTTAASVATAATSNDVLVGAGAQGEGGMREISVKADERGLVIGLTCLLRQAIAQANPGSAIEVGLHLTPLYAGLPASSATSSPTQHQHQPNGGGHAELGPPKSWRCVFDIALATASSGSDNEADMGVGTVALKNGTRLPPHAMSELPPVAGSQVTDTIFKYIGMQLTTGRSTSRGHSWKISAVLPRGKGREPSPDTGRADCPREPTAEELSTFAESALKSRKVVLFAAEDSLFAKHLTCYLASWGTDMSHMPYDRSPLAVQETTPDSPPHQTLHGHPGRLKLDTRAALSRHDSGFGGSSQTTESPPSALLSPSVSTVLDPMGAAGAALKGDTSPAPTSPSFDPSTHFIIIDDDVPTLRAQLVSLRNASPQMQLPAGLAGRNRPSMTKRSKSATQVVKPQHATSILHFTSITRYSHVKEVVRTILDGSHWFVLPDVLVLPKPIGSRRILTALHTAVRRPIIGPSYIPIATSPSSPGSQYHGAATVARHSPALSAGQDFDSAAAAHNSQSNKAASETGGPPEATGTVRTPPITVPGTPSIAPSPQILSHEAMEYFARAACESGGSASTGVVLQSPDGRPQAMFFHHTASTKRVSSQRRKGPHASLSGPSTSAASGGEAAEDGDSGAGSYPGPVSSSPDLEPRASASGRRQSANGGELVRAMTLDKFEAVSPAAADEGRSPTATDATTTPTGATSPRGQRPQATKKPSLLRMPSVTAAAAIAASPFTASPSSVVPPTLGAGREMPKSPLREAASVEGDATPPVQPPTPTASPLAPPPQLLRPSRRQSSTGTVKGTKRRPTKKPAQPIVPPVRVLIVEDNPINQTILAMYLRRKNVYHEIAKDGQQAIDKWKTGNFHLVLMDIQLPIKDGIQATKEIRQAERAANITGFAATPPAESSSIRSQVPILTSVPEPTSPVTSPRNSSVIIVALTASSLDKDRDIALAAGCNDFLTKPVNLDWLNQKLLEWGSMAWLSGFSRPRFSSPTSAGAELGEAHGRTGFMSASSEKRSREVAEHLYLRPRPASGGTAKTPRNVPVGAGAVGGDVGEPALAQARSRMSSVTAADSDRPDPAAAATAAGGSDPPPQLGSETMVRKNAELGTSRPAESRPAVATTPSGQSDGMVTTSSDPPSPSP